MADREVKTGMRPTVPGFNRFLFFILLGVAAVLLLSVLFFFVRKPKTGEPRKPLDSQSQLTLPALPHPAAAGIPQSVL
ncbi:MAG TPA: hypothetical protein VM865_07540 [Acidobacteriaceae bacterium]|jgi:hypothetical protein|nr:hypothetical protein [Acidobacteriaceae bacterium]